MDSNSIKREGTRTFDSEVSLRNWRQDSTRALDIEKGRKNSQSNQLNGGDESENTSQQIFRLRESNQQLVDVNENLKDALTHMQTVRDENTQLREENLRLSLRLKEIVPAGGDGEIGQLRERIKQLEGLVASSEEVMGKMDKLHEEKAALEARCNRLQDALMTENDSLQSVGREKETVWRENKDLSERCKRLEEEVSISKQRHRPNSTELDEEEVKIRDENEDLKQRVVTLQDELNKMKKSAEQVPRIELAKLGEVEDENERLKARCVTLEEEIEALKTESKTFAKVREEEINDLRSKLVALRQIGENATSNAEDSTRHLIRLKNENENLASEIHEKHREVCNLREVIEKLEQLNSNLEQQLDKSREEMKQQVCNYKEHATLQEEKISIQKLLEKSLSLQEKQQSDIKEMTKKIDSQRQNRDADHTLLTKVLDDKDLRIDVLNMNLASPVVRQVLNVVIDLRRSNKQLTQQVAGLKEFVEEQTRLTDESHRELEVARGQIDEIGTAHRSSLEENHKLKNLVQYQRDTLYAIEEERKLEHQKFQEDLFTIKQQTKSMLDLKNAGSREREKRKTSDGRLRKVQMEDIYNGKSFNSLLQDGKRSNPDFSERVFDQGTYMRSHIKKKQFSSK